MQVTFLGNEVVKLKDGNRFRDIVVDGEYTTSNEYEIMFFRDAKFPEKSNKPTKQETPELTQEIDPMKLLKETATEMGIKFRDNIGFETLKNRIEEIKNAG